MMKRALAVFALALVAPVFAQDPPQPQPTDPAPKQEPVRKLSRSERKARIAKLADKYREFLTEVEPIILPAETDTFLVLETDAQRDLFIQEFWRRRDQAAGLTNGAWRDMYLERRLEAKSRFRSYAADRSKAFMIHGQPQNVIVPKCLGELLQPIEIWTYDELPGLGHSAQLIFYVPRRSGDYKLWMPMANREDNLIELLSESIVATSPSEREAFVKVFVENVAPPGAMPITRIQRDCSDGERLFSTIVTTEGLRGKVAVALEPRQGNEDDVRRILRSVIVPNPEAAKLPAEIKIHFPGKQGSRTAAEMTILVPRAAAKAQEVGATTTYSFDVVGEVIKGDDLFENFRYRFDIPADTKDEKLPLVIDRFLRPNDYTVRLRVLDVHTNAEAILEHPFTVPEIFDTAEQLAQKQEAGAAVSALKDAIETNQTQLRIVPLSEEILSGVQHIETIAFGDAIKGVEFYLDGRKIMVKRQPPYTLDLDLGQVPQPRRIRAVAIGEDGKPLTGDEIIVNTGSDPFRVRILSPRVAVGLKGPTRVEMSVKVPEDRELQHLEVFYNETRVATLYGPPWVQMVNISPTEGVGYIRAVATLKDDNLPPVEDVVMINTPAHMEEVNVHLIELPTTVLVGGKPNNTLTESAFKVLDEGKPVKLAKFEYVKNLPLSIGLAFDTSGSMLPRINEAQKAGAEFFKNVLRKGDKAFVIAFDREPHQVQKWSGRVEDIHAALSKLRAEDTTALYDAIVYSLYNFIGVRGQKALVLISDGRDTASKFTFEQALEYARRTAVPIYGIGIGIKGADIDVRYKLAQLTRETGGNMYYIESANELRRIYDDIENELRSQYVLGFYPPDDVKPGGKWREVQVQVTEGKAKTIRGYYP